MIIESEINEGIYKISLPKGNEYFPEPIYIGYSKNIKNRLNHHKREIKAFLEIFLNYEKYGEEFYSLNKSNKERFLAISNLLYKKQIVANGAFYIKIVSFMILENFKFEDIKFEIVKEVKNPTYYGPLIIEEQEEISKNNRSAERLGFNGTNARSWAINFYLKNILINKKEMKILIGNLNKIKKEISNQYSEWVKIKHAIIIEYNLYWKNPKEPNDNNTKWLNFILILKNQTLEIKNDYSHFLDNKY